MANVLIFENEYVRFKNAFRAANVLFFENALKFIPYSRSQDFKNYDEVLSYKYIVIDIDLAERSDLDGFELIQKIKSSYPNAPIIIMTGNTKIDEALVERNEEGIPVIKKPVTFRTIRDVFQLADKLYQEKD